MKTEIELLKDGEDSDTRVRLEFDLSETIRRSTIGEIGLYQFIEEIESVVKDGKDKLQYFNNN